MRTRCHDPNRFLLTPSHVTSRSWYAGVFTAVVTLSDCCHCSNSDSDFTVEFIKSLQLCICVLGKQRANCVYFSHFRSWICNSSLSIHLLFDQKWKSYLSVLLSLHHASCTNFSSCALLCRPPKEEVVSLHKASGYFWFVFLLIVMSQLSPYSLSLNVSAALCLYLMFFRSTSCHFEINIVLKIHTSGFHTGLPIST